MYEDVFLVYTRLCYGPWHSGQWAARSVVAGRVSAHKRNRRDDIGVWRPASYHRHDVRLRATANNDVGKFDSDSSGEGDDGDDGGVGEEGEGGKGTKTWTAR